MFSQRKFGAGVRAPLTNDGWQFSPVNGVSRKNFENQEHVAREQFYE